MKGNRRILLFGVILGIITVFFLNQYIQSLSKGEEANATISYSEVVVAQVSIPQHTRILENMVKLVSIPTDAVHPDAVDSIDIIIDGVTKGEIISGEQVLLGKIVTEDIKADLAYRIPEDMRAITLPIGEISGVANYITRGDKVDILATYNMSIGESQAEGTRPGVAEDEAEDTETSETKERDASVTYTQLQNIEVLEVGPLKAKKPTKTDEEGTVAVEEVQQPGSITILVNPMQAEVIAFATLNGSFHLTLRNPTDNNRIELDHYSFDNFESYKER